MRLGEREVQPARIQFQSTHPMRGATGICRILGVDYYISIHAPHAGCDKLDAAILADNWISIHAPHAGCDLIPSIMADKIDISIHAPHAVCDRIVDKNRRPDGNFNPRTPCGVRLTGSQKLHLRGIFQSTHPMRGATNWESDGRHYG